MKERIRIEFLQEIECARAMIQVDERLGFRYRTVYLYDEDSRMHYHDFYEVFLILAPNVVHYINGKVVPMSRGDLVFTRKQDRHTFEYATTKESSLCNLSFKEEILMKLFTRYFAHVKDTSEDADIPGWMIKLDKEMHQLENFREGTKRMLELSGKTQEHLGRTVKKCYGVTVSEYVNYLRLNYFANTLVTSDIPVLDLCFDCGFQNVSYAYSC